MLFNSFPFLFGFLPVVLAGFFFLGRRHPRGAALWLASASLFFYGWWDYRFLPLLLGSVFFNYGAGILIRKAGGRSLLPLGAALAANLLLLGYFKYRGFFLDSLHRLFPIDWSYGALILPLGISFFTFTQIAFLVDVHQGKAREHQFLNYLLFITYFPHLLAGPILHHGQVMPQFENRETFRYHRENFNIGLTVFIVGLGKKLLLADSFAAYASPLFGIAQAGNRPMLVEAWVAALAYAFQIYFDFSGYSDMAVGLSRMFNVQIPLNFNSPYRAANIIDFWRRWHITLSAFLRDYLYIPLGGNRRGPGRRYLNLFITMILGGLWHGAGWTFVAWGALHGLYLILNHGFLALRDKIGWGPGRMGRVGKVLSVGTTFLAVTLAWVLFRAPDFGTAGRILQGMCGANGLTLPTLLTRKFPALASLLASHGIVFTGFSPNLASVSQWSEMLLAGAAIIWLFPNTQQWLHRYRPAWGKVEEPSAIARRFAWDPDKSWTWIALGLLFGLEIITLMQGKPSEFIYYQF